MTSYSHGAPTPRPSLTPWLLSAAVLAAMALWLWWDGRNLICECGTVRLFTGVNDPDGTSQHISDWYTPSHIIHGLLFFALSWLVMRRAGIGWRLFASVAVEAAWEIVENSEWVIDRYRQVTVSKDYNGDTVLNSACDVVAMMIGFGLARVLPVWASVAIAIGFEILTAIIIRDGLILNVVMLLFPVQGILDWQQGG